MSEQWKTGDVAMVTISHGYRSGPVVGMWADGSWVTKKGKWSRVAIARPLAVIDPENLMEVGRLLVLLEDHDMQAALREFAKPTPPKPDEPTGLGAVVVDDEGETFVRYIPGKDAPWRAVRPADENRPYRYWDGIDAVQVLSEGIQA